MSSRASARHEPPTRYSGSPSPLPSHFALASARATCFSQHALALAAQRGEAEDAQRKRGALAQFAPLQTRHQFEAAAAQVADDPVRVGEGGQNAGTGRQRLLLARQQLDRETNAFAGMRDQRRAVGGVAHGGGGDGAQPRHVHLPREPGEAGQRGPARPASPQAVIAPSAARPRPRPASTFSLNRMAGSRAGPLIDDEPDRVGTDIDDRGARVGLRPRKRPKGGEQVHAPRLKLSVGTTPPPSADAPRPDSDGLVMK